MDKEIHTTTDLYEAAFLYALDSSYLSEIDRTGRIFAFVFSGNDLEKILKEFYSRKATVIAKDYSDAIRTLKDMIFAEFRRREQQVHPYDR